MPFSPNNSKNLPKPLNLAESCRLLRAGGILVYPTETFFAIGCVANNAIGVARIASLKKRRPDKPMPLLAATLAQAACIAHVEIAPPSLYDKFWPGPLTVLLPAKASLPPLLLNAEGKIAIRVSSCAIAAALAQGCGGPITSTSANFSGKSPARDENGLDCGLFYAMREMKINFGFTSRQDDGAASLPSTIVDIIRKNDEISLRIMREGAITIRQLEDAGFKIVA